MSETPLSEILARRDAVRAGSTEMSSPEPAAPAEQPAVDEQAADAAPQEADISPEAAPAQAADEQKPKPNDIQSNLNKALRQAREETRQERASREALEAKLSEIDALKQQLEALKSAPKPQDMPKPAPAPDFWAAPEEAMAHFQTQMRLEMSEMDARRHYGDQTFDEAQRALEAVAAQQPWAVQRVLKSRHPGEELVKWHREQKTLAAIPDTDVEKLRAQMRAEIEAEIASKTAQAAQQQAAAPAQPKLPDNRPQNFASMRSAAPSVGRPNLSGTPTPLNNVLRLG